MVNAPLLRKTKTTTRVIIRTSSLWWGHSKHTHSQTQIYRGRENQKTKPVKGVSLIKTGTKDWVTQREAFLFTGEATRKKKNCVLRPNLNEASGDKIIQVHYYQGVKERTKRGIYQQNKQNPMLSIHKTGELGESLPHKLFGWGIGRLIRLISQHPHPCVGRSSYPISCGSRMNCLHRRKQHLALSLVRCLFAFRCHHHLHYHRLRHYHLTQHRHHHHCPGHCTRQPDHLSIQHSNLNAQQEKRRDLMEIEKVGRVKIWFLKGVWNSVTLL